MECPRCWHEMNYRTYFNSSENPIDYFGSDPGTNSIVIYMESLSNARKFLSAARAFARTKPIIVLKVGKTASMRRGKKIRELCIKYKIIRTKTLNFQRATTVFAFPHHVFVRQSYHYFIS